MIETDEQRRWWFATHPEYSWSRKGIKSRGHGNGEAEPPVYSPEEIDAYVEEGLKYFPTGPVAALLKALKWGLGTNEGPTPLDFLFHETGPDGTWSQPDNESTKSKNDEKIEESSFWDSVVQGIDKTLEFWGLAGVLIPSAELAKNLAKAGFPRPADHVPHHIVPTHDKRFPECEKSRVILEKFKIGIHDAENGAWLPAKRDIVEGAYHPALHSGEYYRRVERFLSSAKTRDEAIRVLKKIGDKLSKGTFFE